MYIFIHVYIMYMKYICIYIYNRSVKLCAAIVCSIACHVHPCHVCGACRHTVHVCVRESMCICVHIIDVYFMNT